MEPKYILGIQGIAKYFGLSLSEAAHLLKNGGIPGAFKLKRKQVVGFNGGGRGVWALNRKLAEQYQHTRKKTLAYDPSRATVALLNKFSYSGAENIPELIDGGFITDLDWCDELRRQREISNLHIPILMHPADLEQYLRGVDRTDKGVLYSATAQIFKAIRNRG